MEGDIEAKELEEFNSGAFKLKRLIMRIAEERDGDTSWIYSGRINTNTRVPNLIPGVKTLVQRGWKIWPRRL